MGDLADFFNPFESGAGLLPDSEGSILGLPSPGDTLGAFSGQAGAEASLEAARMQTELGREGIETQREFLDRMLSQTEPFQELGLGQADRLNQLLSQGFQTGDIDRARSLVGQPNQNLNRLNQLLSQPGQNQSLQNFISQVNNPGRNQNLQMFNEALSSPEQNQSLAMFRNAIQSQPENQNLSMFNESLASPTENQNLALLNQQLADPSQNQARQRLNALTTDPNAQAEFIQDNPFYESLTNQARQDLLANQAARGKVGSGETAAGLQDRYLQIGNQLLGQEVGRLQGVAGLNEQAGSNRISQLMGGAGLQSDIESQRLGQLAQGAGLQSDITGQQIDRFARGAGLESGIQGQRMRQLATGAGLQSDITGQQLGQLAQGAGLESGQRGQSIQELAAGAGLQADITGQDISNLMGISGQQNQLLQNQFGNTMQTVGLGANAAAGQGTGIQNTGNQITNLLTGIGNAQAAGGIGAANAYGQGASNLAGLAGTIASFFSDRAVKTDIEQIGEVTTDKGTYPTYTFRYIWDDQRYLGVMSDDVREINPAAVSNEFGLDVVNYAEL